MHPIPKNIDLAAMKPFYKGSVQNLYELDEYPDLLVSETTAGGSVFDVGTIFSIAGSDISRACFRHYIYQQLADSNAWTALANAMRADGRWQFIQSNQIFSQLFFALETNGATTHHLGMIDSTTGVVHKDNFPQTPGNMSLIEKYQVHKPRQSVWQNKHFYDYSVLTSGDNYVIPLEYIVRFGVANSSSILSRYNSMTIEQQSAFLIELGLDRLSAWQKFAIPVTDCTSKYESEDRALNLQEAALMSELSGERFCLSLALAVLASYLVEAVIKPSGLALWDLKWEIASKGDSLVIVDTIDTDSMRLTMAVEHKDKSYIVHFDKQAMRNYYRIMHPQWFAAVLDAKRCAVKTGDSFVSLLQAGQNTGQYPPNPELDRRFMDIQEGKFKLIQDSMCMLKTDWRKGEFYQLALHEVDYYLQSSEWQVFQGYNGL